jgi:hypothetical protein
VAIDAELIPGGLAPDPIPGAPVPGAPASSPTPGPPTPGGDGFRRTGLVVAAVVVVVALLAAGLATTVFAGSDHPSGWDARLGDLPETVTRLRGLEFAHAVPVRFLPNKRFVEERAIGGASKPSARAKRAARRATESLRALGLVSGPVDLIAATKQANASRVLAFYDPDAEEIVIRGGTKALDVPHRVVLVHELTHVLQDQHFDLAGLEDKVRDAPGQSSDALRAVIEGDADRIEDEYTAELSTSDRDAYEEWQRRGSDVADRETASLPAVLTVLQGAPYAFGPAVLEVVTADGGNSAVDRVFEHGVFTQKLFVEPTASFTEAPPEPIAAPEAAEGEKAVDRVTEFGAFDLYLLLASRIDATVALDVASRWDGGRIRLVRADGRTCARAAVTATSRAGSAALEDALQQWADALPAGMASIARHGDVVEVHSCDPGTTGLVSPDAGVRRAENVLGAHNEIEVALVRETRSAGLPLRTAKCAAMAFVRSPEFGVLLARPEADVTSEAVEQAIAAAAPGVRRACGL